MHPWATGQMEHDLCAQMSANASARVVREEHRGATALRLQELSCSNWAIMAMLDVCSADHVQRPYEKKCIKSTHILWSDEYFVAGVQSSRLRGSRVVGGPHQAGLCRARMPGAGASSTWHTVQDNDRTVKRSSWGVLGERWLHPF